jgi:hypothetical protein
MSAAATSLLLYIERTQPSARLLEAFMWRWFVSVPWLLRIDVVHM